MKISRFTKLHFTLANLS